MSERLEEIRQNLADVHTRIATACSRAGRSAAEVTLVAVTKTRPADDVRALAQLGVGDIGENRDQEAAAKAAECADLDVRWHFVGQLQTRKARSVARYAYMVHSVDRPRLIGALGRGARDAHRTVRCLVQVNLDPPGISGELATRGGVPPTEAVKLADKVVEEEGLELAGVMAVASRQGDPEAGFAVLADAAAAVRERYPQADVVSAGMSGDLELAVAHGATHLRIGAALLGDRAPIVG
ncbi:YggS family pyridoxal phosphate-dependent enzyme [Lipingzhangella sp. LS1_29]|uniref:Pyridoxal phosphate homeostasis protein n=1 Tax=Lipingzhangella rawalii TaxID=2055835 RepID=A0ABU2H276_9ACTN|nr:YggS family pyridoxal phosphate-dependent enzyme [Lipingzhangella rawalii]MDS1269393.1 YggS family pyridoxal phosphate-dependent enzyme [Lipingzhangella rawalii]